MNPRLEPLTSLRFFAALGVFLYHCGSLGTPRPEWLAMGVSFFFVLSGFVLAYAHAEIPSVREFYVKRIARIWPVHLLTLLLGVLFLGNTLFSSVTLLNASLLHAWIPADKVLFSLNSVSWSVSDEWFFYLLFPLLVRSRRIAPWVIGSALAAAALMLLADRYWTQPLGAADFTWLRVVRQNPVSRLFEFTVGVALGRYFLRQAGQPPRWLRVYPTWAETGAVAVAALCVAVVTSDIGWSSHPGTTAWLARAGAGPGFLLLIFVFSHGRGQLSRWLSWPPLVLLGEISYSTYLLHHLGIRFVQKYALTETLGLPLTLLLLSAAVYGASYAVWRWFEKPMRHAIVARFARA